MTRRRYIPLLCTAALLGSGTSAEAQDGVTFDKPGDSPAQKEYAIPLDQARKDASDGGTSSSAPTTESSSTASGGTSASHSAPLFGQGVGDGVGTVAKGQSQTTTGGAKAPSGGGARSSVDSALASTRAGTAVTSKQGGGALTIGAVALAVLLLGGVLGSIASRRSGS